MIKNLKTIFAPIQKWLLANKQCVGCGRSLDKAKYEVKNDTEKKVTCRCGRLYIYQVKNGIYRRALSEEV